MGGLREFLKCLEGSMIDVTTEYSKVTGVLIDVNFDYIVLKTGGNLLYIPLESIQNIAY